jgi:hypothetical protein
LELSHGSLASRASMAHQLSKYNISDMSLD